MVEGKFALNVVLIEPTFCPSGPSEAEHGPSEGRSALVPSDAVTLIYFCQNLLLPICSFKEDEPGDQRSIPISIRAKLYCSVLYYTVVIMNSNFVH